jgi:hypothetical protein
MPKQRECILIQTVTKTHDFDRVPKQLIMLKHSWLLKKIIIIL